MKIISTILYTICGILLISIAGAFLISTLPISGNIEIKIVQSGSMAPSIPVGALVMIKPQEGYQVGDVITFGETGPRDLTTTHRIVSIREEGNQSIYTTKGDANEEADTQETAESAVVGKVLFDVPYAGFVLDFARQPIGFAFLIGLPAAIIIIDELIAIALQIRRMRKGAKLEAVESSEEHLQEERQEQEPKSKEEKYVLSPPSLVYLRRHRMDEVRAPIYVRIRMPRSLEMEPRFFNRTTAASIILLISLVPAALVGTLGTTISYFSDLEATLGNQLTAGELNFIAEVPGEDTAEGYYELEEGGSITIYPTIAPSEGSFPTQYWITTEKQDGSDAFCEALRVDASTAPFLFNGSLLDLVVGPLTEPGSWPFEVIFSSDEGVNSGDECVVDLVYSGWHEEGSQGEGYTDEERISLDFEANLPISAGFFLFPTALEPETLTASDTPEIAPRTKEKEDLNATSTDPIDPGAGETGSTTAPELLENED